ncbi:macro domain-containing protein [Arcanobacterium bovis]|uniref:Appr-1-p processing protein n=1 Tax=Arcanobacterium bovis TaxID=2529275 RepID=A0A4Q9UZ85_9ACTO|nr:macro domain-containing protein [Arcanobacterium bovis]TBW21062.1 Appr-1-p processing protein [Arcanobacterium bovis]
MLKLSEYRDLINLDCDFPDPKKDKRSNYDLLMTALGGLRNKHFTGTSSMAHLSTDDGLFRWLQAELSLREPAAIDPITSRAINTLLYRETGKRGRVEASHLRRVSEILPECDYLDANQVVLYRGDIRQLVVDAVVNPALPELTGCPIPLHGCLDSEIHAQAGPWLRNDCAKIIELQGHNEEPGDVTMTRGYRMPTKYIIHALGPDVKNREATDADRLALRNCYLNALDLAAEKGDIHSIAFPAISTGWNGFPVHEAATIALGAVEDWMKNRTSEMDLVVFSVHSDEDAEVYMDILARWVAD